MADLLGLRNPFFRPLGRRLAVIAATLGWAAFEAVMGNTGWAFLLGAIGAFCAWEFLIAFDPANYEDKA